MKSKHVFTSTLIAALLLVSSMANAQLRVGLRAEVGLNTVTATKADFSVENLNSFKVGPSVEFMLPLVGLGVDASVLYSNEKLTVNNVQNKENISKLLDVKEHFVDVPVNLKYKIGLPLPVNMFVAAGPYAQFKVGGDDIATMEKTLSASIKDKKFQAGVNVGLGIEAFRTLQIGVNYRIKLTDDYSTDSADWNDLLNNRKDGIWSLTASLYF